MTNLFIASINASAEAAVKATYKTMRGSDGDDNGALAVVPKRFKCVFFIGATGNDGSLVLVWNDDIRVGEELFGELCGGSGIEKHLATVFLCFLCRKPYLRCV